MRVTAPMCVYCVHLHQRVKGSGTTRTCNAFPEGIPDDIWWEAGDHTISRAGDQGIIFTPDGTLTEERFRKLYPDAVNPPT